MKILQIKHIIFFLLPLIFIPFGSAQGHKVIIFAWVEDGIIHSQSNFGSKREAKNCDISVHNQNGEIVHKGKTDQKGNFSFKIPKNIDSNLTLTLDAGQGHQAHWKISEPELKNPSSDNSIKIATKNKAKLEENPSFYKVILGITLIFLLAFVLRMVKKTRQKKAPNKEKDMANND